MSSESENDFRLALEDSDSESELYFELNSQSEYERGINSELDSQSEHERRFSSELDSQSEHERGFNELDSETDFESSQQVDCSVGGDLSSNVDENIEDADDIFIPEETSSISKDTCPEETRSENSRQVQEGTISNQIDDDYWTPIKRKLKTVIKKRPVKPDFVLPPGPMVNTKHWKTVDYFLQFFPLQAFEKIAEETNRYASQFLNNSDKLSKSSRFRSWKNTDIPEMMAFVALQIAMGLVNKPSISDYWEKSGITDTPFFSNVMSRNRYEILSSFLHFNNNELRLPKGTPEYDPLFKIRPIIDMVMPTYLDSYCPDKNISVDESLRKFKGRLSYKQHMPRKKNRYGIKIWALCDANNGYVLAWKVYTGAKGGGPKTVKDVVLDLCEPIYNTGRTVYCDNYFSSPALFAEMKSKGLNTCGVVNPLRLGLPSGIRNKLIKLRRGDEPRFFYQSKTGLLACIWHDTKYVAMLSSIHDNQTFEVLSRVKKYGNKFMPIKKPKMVKDYNNYMKGVDLMDQKMSYYKFSSRNNKSYHVIYHFIKDVALINGHILYNSSNHESISSKDFRKKVIFELMDPYVTKKNMEPKIKYFIPDRIESNHRLIGKHFIKPLKKGSSKDCVVCSNRKANQRQRTTFYCSKCEGTPFMCPGNCFERYHTLENYKIIY